MKPRDKLKELYLEYNRIKHPNLPESVRSFPTYFSKSGTTNGLTKCIIAYIRLNGWMAERITSSGRVVDKSKVFTDVCGFTRQIGSKSYIPGTSQKGTADISATVMGKSVKIEVKNANTKDRMSGAQREYKTITDITGGIYYIAKDFDMFVEWFDKKFEMNPSRFEIYKHFILNESVKI